jgi:hypothetical protein
LNPRERSNAGRSIKRCIKKMAILNLEADDDDDDDM